jgi:DnaK suppressor protein
MSFKKELIEELQKKLIKEKESLKKSLNDFAIKNSENSDDWKTKFPNFRAEGALDEEADEVEEYSSLLPVEKTLELKLQKINEALKKIESDKYGVCESCTKEIEIDRLKLIPETKFCNECKK